VQYYLASSPRNPFCSGTAYVPHPNSWTSGKISLPPPSLCLSLDIRALRSSTVPFTNSSTCHPSKVSRNASVSRILHTLKPVKLAALLSRPRFYKTRKFLWYYTRSLLRNLAISLSWNLATISYLVLYFLYKFIVPTLAELNSYTIFVSYCTRAEILNH
jgi:hypothetical protein